MVADGDDRERARLAPPQPDEPGGIELLEHQLVVACAQAVAEDLRRAVVVVDAHVVEAAAVGEPDDAAVRALDQVGQVLADGEVADTDRVELGAFNVGAPGESAVIRRVRRLADREERMSLALTVAIEHHGVGAIDAPLAADQWLLTALPVTRVVEPWTIGQRDAGVSLLHAPAHLGDESTAEQGQRRQVNGGIGVFLFQRGADVDR